MTSDDLCALMTSDDELDVFFYLNNLSAIVSAPACMHAWPIESP